jgi:hypothetical protein
MERATRRPSRLDRLPGLRFLVARGSCVLANEARAELPADRQAKRVYVMRVRVIRTDGTDELLDIDKGKAIDEIPRLIGAEMCDTVGLGDGMVMMVDDAGWETRTVDHGSHIELVPTVARKPINQKATTLYHGICKPGTTHQIAGDVAIVRDEDFE